MEITRRQFLASTSALAVAVAMPTAALAAVPETLFVDPDIHVSRTLFVNFGLKTGLDNGTSWGNAFRSVSSMIRGAKPNDKFFVTAPHTAQDFGAHEYRIETCHQLVTGLGST